MVRLEVWGDYALFSRPELKTERVSYDVMTPSAARGILEAVYWHPGMKWTVDKIYVLSPIRFANIRRNEVRSKILASDVRKAINGKEKNLCLVAQKEIQQRAAMVLQDVHYVIEAHFDLTEKANETDNEGKFQDIMRRRVEKGQCYHQPYFGTREFPACFRPWCSNTIPTIPETRDLGYMLLDLDFSDPADIQPVFFRAKLDHGVLIPDYKGAVK